MQGLKRFNTEELSKVDGAVKASEELVNNYFKMSSGQWLKNRYDIKTAKDLALHECIDGPFAQVIKYEGRKKDVSLGSSSFSLYKVCLQDNAILAMVLKNDDLFLEPFLLYILTHELIHIVRFSKFKQRYENKNEVDVTLDEERKVHVLTHTILKSVSVPGLSKVCEFYKDWLKNPESKT
ncbi:MAG: hypothetical protein HOG03_05750 [Desulfobacula sp.]|jgi:hypothetical protein|uniref:hypothetical protein n=1 Tax=Desulfobacula sp. TaxID=2593537 RepID=UPI001D1F30BC|nr:hypothetical protein [Desulfobacula sp.]MBT3485166.1 hypothetical protein [Desulfobacula sp.]MBT3804089.1 hypothetical protein [Desulfobacula sp.]MBT4025370.1 hypothetical protein [Desulfobacula sp.]MBT4199478.1 hypothetical protein [Desulfobacula sp.]